MENKFYIVALDGVELSFIKNSIGHKAVQQLISEGVQPEFLSSSCIMQYIHNYLLKWLKQKEKIKNKIKMLKSKDLPAINYN
jgi:hypothetical protein